MALEKAKKAGPAKAAVVTTASSAGKPKSKKDILAEKKKAADLFGEYEGDHYDDMADAVHDKYDDFM